MAIAILLTPVSLTVAQYDECLRQLEAASAGTPPDRLAHLCYGSGAQLRLFEVWESREAFERHWAKLRPLLQELGVEPGQPELSELHRMRFGLVSRRRMVEVLSTLPAGAWLGRARGQGQQE